MSNKNPDDYVNFNMLSLFKSLIDVLFNNHKNDSNIHISTDEKSNLKTAYEHSQADHAPADAEKNVISSISRNGTTLSPNSSRNVNISVYDSIIETISTYGWTKTVYHALSNSKTGEVGPKTEILSNLTINRLDLMDELTVPGTASMGKVSILNKETTYLDLNNSGSTTGYQSVRFGYFLGGVYEKTTRLDGHNIFLNANNNLWSSKALNNISDARKKNSSEILDENNIKTQKYIEMWESLKPRVFKMNNEGDTYHIGYFAQEVEEALYEAGLSDDDFSGICKIKDFVENNSNSSEIQNIDDVEYFEELYALSYTDCLMLTELKLRQVVNEVIPDLTKQIEDMRNEISTLKVEISNLKGE